MSVQKFNADGSECSTRTYPPVKGGLKITPFGDSAAITLSDGSTVTPPIGGHLVVKGPKFEVKVW